MILPPPRPPGPARCPKFPRLQAHLPQIMHRHAGLTLVELLAVVVILGLLAVTLTTGFMGRFRQARHEVARVQIGQLVQAVESFQVVQRRYPTQSEGLDILTETPGTAWHVDAKRLLDPWNKAYIYQIPGPDGHPFVITSLGADGQPGGEGENADIASSE